MKKLLTALCAVAMTCVCAVSMTACNNSKVKIGVQNGTTGEYYVKGDADWGFEGFSNVECKGYTNGGLAVNDMKNGNVKYVVIDEAPAKYLVEKVAGIKVIDIKLTEEEYAFGVRKTTADGEMTSETLLAKSNEYLAKILSDGTFDTILNKYFGDGTPTGVTSATQDNTKADKQLVIATNAAFAPFEYVEGNKFYGIDIEIASGLAEFLGMELVVSDMDFDSVVTSVGKNGVDIAMAGLTVNEKRKESVNFSTSYYQASQKLVCLSSETKFDACKTASEIEAILKTL